ncbi:MAG: hypothetical protein AAF420_11740 [Pseudomonadota bacterium]
MQFTRILFSLFVMATVIGCEELQTSGESGTFNDTTCDVCRSMETVQLQWVPDSQEVVGYRVYYSAEPYISERELSTLDSSTDNFDLENPSVSYHAWSDLSLYKGDNVCFRILSFTLSGNESLSQEACGTLPDSATTADNRSAETVTSTAS